MAPSEGSPPDPAPNSVPNSVPDSVPAQFEGLRVAAFESRRAGDIERLILRHGGEPFVSPSMREVPLDDNTHAIEFAHRLITGEIDVVVFLTGVGFGYLLEAVQRSIDRQRYLDSLADVVTIVRGPKPAAAMGEQGLKPTHRVPEPNTWRELLSLFDQHLALPNLHIALQEYGKTNPSLIAGLEARGARVLRVPIYRWDLPQDAEPLRANVRRMAAGEVDVALFTSAQQALHVCQVAEQLGLLLQLREHLSQIVIASIGPTTSEMLRQLELPVDLEPVHPKMGQLVAAAAARTPQLQARKQRIAAMLTGPMTDPTDTHAPWYDSPFLRACRREPTEVTPVWLMRQAGRYMQEYRQVRAQTTFLELCKNPQLCSEVMCTAVERLGVDAAIIFSDLLPILEPMGMELEFAPGEGPVIHNPVREAGDVDKVLELRDMDALHFVVETVAQTRADLPEDIPLIGFAGAPFTLASYAIEGGASRSYLHTKTLMYRDEGAWQALMERLARSVTIYLKAQISAGAQCVQLFDSWAGCLGPQDYRRYVLPWVTQIVQSMPEGVPVINFATGNPALLPLLAEAGSAVVGVDWRIELAEAWNTIGDDRAVQGNLDPLVLLADRDTIRRRVKALLDTVRGRPGHIFNLGHGVVPQTPVDNAIALVEAVHEFGG